MLVIINGIRNTRVTLIILFDFTSGVAKILERYRQCCYTSQEPNDINELEPEVCLHESILTQVLLLNFYFAGLTKIIIIINLLYCSFRFV